MVPDRQLQDLAQAVQKDSRRCRTVGAVGQVSQDFEAALGLTHSAEDSGLLGFQIWAGDAHSLPVTLDGEQGIAQAVDQTRDGEKDRFCFLGDLGARHSGKSVAAPHRRAIPRLSKGLLIPQTGDVIMLR